ncbi:alpha/beta hydrolase fold-3 domain protein [Aspergillus unguis]
MPLQRLPASRFSYLGLPSSEWTEFSSKNAAIVPSLVGSPEHLRMIMKDLKVRAARLTKAITEGLAVQDVQVSTSDNSMITVRVYDPELAQKPCPVVLYIHGGGWTLGDLEGEDGTCRAMCVQCSVVVVSVDYRLAPEFPYPIGLNDCWDALNWVSVPYLSSEQKAAVLTHRARDANLSIKGQVLRIPSLCHIHHYPPGLHIRSMEELKDGPLLLKKSMELFYRYYNPPDPSDPSVSPLLSKDFSDLPRTYMQIAGMDPLRDEALAYVDKLIDAGVDVTVDIYPGLPHAFGYFPELPSAKKNTEDLCRGISQIVAKD